MTFTEYPYTRPIMDEFSANFNSLIENFINAPDADAQNAALEVLDAERRRFDNMRTLCQIRHTVDTTDKFYDAENDYFDEVSPAFQELNNNFYKALVAARFRKELEARWGKQFFTIADLALETFRPEILDRLEVENKLCSEYVKLRATARIPFQDAEYNLSTIYPFEIDPNREVRKSASAAKWQFFVNNAPQLEGIYHKLVEQRHAMAQALGYPNFVGLGYSRMLRSDYNAAMVADFRQQVLEHIVPLAQRLIERQSKRIGVDKIKFYDEGYQFSSGNPKPHGTPEWILENARTMYKELSPETHKFFEDMVEADVMDLLSKPNKAPGGYCTFLPEHQMPFIYSNFNGTSGDIDVLTHEAGHAFQAYESRHFVPSEYTFPTYEACEIHSMSMEFFTWPWMELYFKEDTLKYKFSHLAGQLLFLPYGVAVDEFQHAVYENPLMSTAERNATWRAIERKYLPHRDYDGNEFLENGGFWLKQAHIFESPFYYIDYTLAEVCALQFWVRAQLDFEGAWKDYVTLCKAGGSKSFLDLVKLANLESPFSPGIVAKVANFAAEWLDKVDDSSF